MTCDFIYTEYISFEEVWFHGNNLTKKSMESLKNVKNQIKTLKIYNNLEILEEW